MVCLEDAHKMSLTAQKWETYRFTSKEFDRETGLYYFGARYYEPKLSNWMSVDPSGFELINPMDSEGKPRKGYNIVEALNWYAYAGNNPVIFVDPAGEKITLQVHEVLGSGRFHVSLKITPDNQDAYKNNKDFQKYTDSDGNNYITIGAGPKLFNRLQSDINRKNDINEPKVETIDLDLGGRDEDEVIASILAADANYGDDADYDLFLKGGDDVGRRRDGYNSNSFISGLLRAIGLAPPEVESNVPAYEKPLPEEYFMRDSWMPPKDSE